MKKNNNQFQSINITKATFLGTLAFVLGSIPFSLECMKPDSLEESFARLSHAAYKDAVKPKMHGPTFPWETFYDARDRALEISHQPGSSEAHQQKVFILSLEDQLNKLKAEQLQAHLQQLQQEQLAQQQLLLQLQQQERMQMAQAYISLLGNTK